MTRLTSTAAGRTRVSVTSWLAKLEWWFLVVSAPLALLVLVLSPKLMLTDYVNGMLLGDVTGWARLFALAQDLLLAWITLGVCARYVPRWPWPRLLGLWLVIGVVVLLLFIDLRVRELWLKPLDAGVVSYFFDQFAILSSSSGLFLTATAGFGLTFRRLLVVTLAVHAVFGMALLALRQRHRERVETALAPHLRSSWWCVAALLLLAALSSPRYIYSLQDTLGVTQARSYLLASRHAAPPHFEQPLQPAAKVLASPRVRLGDAAPFRNLVLVILESFRVRGIDVRTSPYTPNLRRIATGGLTTTAHVSVPHSSKGVYAILSGRIPSSSIVIREATSFREASVVQDLIAQRGARTYAFSTPYLAFENMEGLLRAHGFQQVFGGEKLAELSRVATKTSYGTGDEALISAPAQLLKSKAGPFACVILTSDAHHPYVFPDKRNVDDDGWDSYVRSIEHTDRIIGGMVSEFGEAGLLEDTLFVFVGDHGESFGEHGAFVHNNSLYEEEITVPLIFWSKDGRLHHEEHLNARQIDAAPTIADLMGLTQPAFETQGVSVLRAARAPAAFSASFFEGVSQALVVGHTKYMLWPSSGRLVRFDLARDAEERSPSEVQGQERDAVLARFESARAYEQSVWSDR